MAESVVSNFNTLYLLSGFNNYFNRTVKKLSAISDYEAASASYEALANINFNPADGISTTQVINPASVTNPDYVLVMSGEEIVSRWFVLECHRNRKGQYTLLLRRDVVADNLDALRNADFFCEKGYVGTDNPLLLNGENMNFNQIKESETTLQDETQSAWIVGYISKPTTDDPIEVQGDVSVFAKDLDFITPEELPEGFPTDYEGTGFKTAYGNPTKMTIYAAGMQQRVAGRNRVYKNVNVDYDIKLEVTYNADGYPNVPNQMIPDSNVVRPWVDRTEWQQSTEAYPCLFETGTSAVLVGTQDTVGLDPKPYSYHAKILGIANAISPNYELFEVLLPSTPTEYNPPAYFDDEHMVSNFASLNGRILKVTEGGQTNYYQINILTWLPGVGSLSFKGDNATLYPVTQEIQSNLGSLWFSGAEQQYMYHVSYEVAQYLILFNKVTLGTVHASIQKNRNHLNEAPYDMFFMPYNATLVDESGTEWTTERAASMALAFGMTPASAGGYLFDLQLLPYCPSETIREMLKFSDDGRKILLDDLHFNETDYTLIYSGTGTAKKAGIMFWATSAKGSINIPYIIEIDPSESTEAIEWKVNNECDLYRIVSPNYNGSFDFSLAKNGGRINFFNVDYEYKPQTPYIHVNPDFSNLYGQDFDDARGMICGGDFSLPLISDAWEAYQIQNKNYNAIFDREIQNMDTKNDINIRRATFNTGMASAAALWQGAQTGTWAGLAKGAVQGAGAAVTGAVNIALGQETYREDRQYAIDKFNYQLGNVQALPQSLSKVSSFNPNNKLFPFIEHYTCTDVEKQALRDKIRCDGMTIMAIGKILDFKGEGETYIKGQIIRCPDLADDAHMLSECYNELNRGLFF